MGKKGEDDEEADGDFIAVDYSDEEEDGDDLVQRLIVDKAIQRKLNAAKGALAPAHTFFPLAPLLRTRSTWPHIF